MLPIIQPLDSTIEVLNTEDSLPCDCCGARLFNDLRRYDPPLPYGVIISVLPKDASIPANGNNRVYDVAAFPDYKILICGRQD